MLRSQNAAHQIYFTLGISLRVAFLIQFYKRIRRLEVERGIQAGALPGPATKNKENTIKRLEDVEDIRKYIHTYAFLISSTSSTSSKLLMVVSKHVFHVFHIIIVLSTQPQSKRLKTELQALAHTPHMHSS